MNARERQVAEALQTERIVSMIEDGLPTPRERQVQRHVELIERVLANGPLPGLPGGPPLANHVRGFTPTIAAEDDVVFTFGDQSFSAREAEWTWTPDGGQVTTVLTGLTA